MELQLKLSYQSFIDIWQQYCSLHKDLYELTLDEYSALLKSDLDLLETLLDKKNSLIGEIKELEEVRQRISADLALICQTPINNVSDLVTLAEKYNLDNENILKKYNLLLADIINQIQEQNKRNQFFLNKAIHSIQELKENFKGKKNYKTYDNKGVARAP
jgi:flagellar biosynthesis/type III secretory pathway chaperone